ncbi:spore germination protein [Ferdinandcohnia sp. Marseille-Q9671]
MFKQKKKQEKEYTTISELLVDLKKSKDFVEYYNPQSPQGFYIYYFSSIVDSEILHRDILKNVNELPVVTLDDVKKAVPIESITITNDVNKVKSKILRGAVLVLLSESDTQCALINCVKKEGRQVSPPEIEFSVVGPKESFVENINKNINLIRNRLPDTMLTIEEIKVGEETKTKVAILYKEGIANEENVNTIRQRIEDIQIDHVVDSSYIPQLLSDNSKSPFPQSLDTERPDRVTSVLVEGSIVVLVDGSPHSIILPATFLEFFSSFEDYYLNWLLSSGFRLIRLISVLFSIMATPVYVATLTYHYVLIPRELLITLVASRQGVPLPPILEALFLEVAIELLREAGARLPTKIGQTIGIVGGIVLGTASVEAGLASNVLLIIVALAALGSFTTPVYQMGNTIRFLRFPFLLAAFMFGLPGIALCFCFVMIHLVNLTSIGRPYLEPIYPPRTRDFKDSFIRLPFSFQSKRPVALQTESTVRFSTKKAKQKKDIDD